MSRFVEMLLRVAYPIALLLQLCCTNGVSNPEVEALEFLEFDGSPCAIDFSSHEMLFPLPEQYEEPREFRPRITYGSDDDMRLTIDGVVVESGQICSFGEVAITDTIAVGLSNGGNTTDYVLVFSGLPIIQLFSCGAMEEVELPALFVLTAPHADQNIHTCRVGIDIRGGLSAEYEKKPYAVEFREKGDWYTKVDVALLGMRSDDDWILDPSYLDPLHMRNRISHDLFLALWDMPFTPQGQSAVKGAFVEVFLNGRYHGTYVLSERVDRKLLDIEEGGLLFKARYTAFSDFRNKYRLVYPKAFFAQECESAWAALEELWAFVEYSDDEKFAAGVVDLVDLRNVVNYHILLLVTSAMDNDERNYFLARNGSGPFFFVPWDLDATFRTIQYWQDNFLIRRLMTLETYRAALKERWAEVRQTVLSEGELIHRFEDYYDSLANSGAFERDAHRWPSSMGYREDFLFVKYWIHSRLSWLDQRMAAL